MNLGKGRIFLLLLSIFPILIFSWKSHNIGLDRADPHAPLILWWSQDFFPHIQPRTNDEVIELQCKNSQQKCLVTQNRQLLKKSSSHDERLMTVMFYGSDFDPEDIPLPKRSNHLWALFNEESPQNGYALCHNETAKVFNFTSTYKRKSNFPLTTQHYPNLEYLIKRKPVDINKKNELRKAGLAPVVYLQSHCSVPSDRDRYIQELMKYIDVDAYGGCLKNKNFDNTSLDDTSEMHNQQLYSILANYKFHIAFENAICDDYITEKFTRPLHLGSVPVYRGSPWIKDFAPTENSVIVADDFKSPRDLAKYLNFLDQHDSSYLKHLSFKDEVSNNFLVETLNTRGWTIDGYEEDYFIGGFECYVCDQMHQVLKEKSSTGKSKPRVVNKEHLNCPAPSPSYGSIDDVPPNDHMHNWLSDYWQQLDISRALADMVRHSTGDELSFSVWDYIEKWYDEGKGALQHTEL